MSSRYECDWCGAMFGDRAKIAAADMTVGQFAGTLHCCVDCAPEYLGDYFPEDAHKRLYDGGDRP